MSDVKVINIEDVLTPAAVSKNRVGSMTHLFPRGNLTEVEAIDALQEAVETAVAEQEIQLIIDMVSVALINSAGLESLFDLRQRLAKTAAGSKSPMPSP